MKRPATERAARVCLFGASPSTGNLGLDALYEATLAGLARRRPALEATVFDHSWRPRETRVRLGASELAVRFRGAHHTHRLWRRDALWNMRWSGRLGGLGNPQWSAIRDADLVLDLSGGDSFTDLYGRHRFEAIVLPKELAVAARSRLCLLPQTYGPFERAPHRDRARAAILAAESAWARDPWSFARLAELLGERFDPARHRLGADLAFALEPRAPAAPLDEEVERWLAGGGGPVVGLNASGLVLNGGAAAERRFRFVADYRATLLALVAGLLERAGTRVVLVPHVLAPPGRAESDPDANCALLAALPAKARERVRALPGPFTAGEVKQLVARLDWFCGTRMHATIAALSSGVPAVAIAYSPKFQGVFELCGLGAAALDPTRLATAELAAAILAAYDARAEARASLAAHLPRVRERVEEALDAAAALLPGAAPRAREA